MYFFYQKSPTGKWHACKSMGKPSSKSVEGNKPQFVQVVELTKDQEKHSLQELERFYPLNLPKDEEE